MYLWGFAFTEQSETHFTLNFLLKNLEHELSDQHLVVGEKLWEEGKVTKLFENEHHLWIASVDGFEVEMQISPSKVKACSCECDVFERERMCGHVAAGLLNLRRKLSETVREPRQDQRTKTFSHQKLTVNAILDSVTQDELGAFVRNFARTNKQFSLALRAKFAAKVTLADNREKFGLLLDAAIQTYRKANDRISAVGVRQLQKMLEELLGQADDATALEHFGEAWAILAAIIGRFSPIMKKLEGDDPALRDQLQMAFGKIAHLVSLPIPPDLQEDISQFCEAEFSRPSYRLNGFSGQLLETWAAISKDDEAARQVLQAIDHELEKAILEANYRSQLHLVKLDLLEMPGLKPESKAFTLECLSAPQKLMQVVDAVEPSGDFRRIKPLVEKGHRLINDLKIKSKLEAIQLQIAQAEGQADVITVISRQKFLETQDFEFYNKCQENHKGNWESFVKSLLADLVRRYDYRHNFPTIAHILGREGKLDELLGLLDEQQSLDLLGQFDHYLLKKKPEAVFNLYEKLLKHFLADHLGLKASKRLRAVLNHLHKQGAGALAEKLFTAIKSAFPKRRFYMEEVESIGGI